MLPVAVAASSAPVISGINHGQTYCESVVVTVKDDDLDTVTLNGSRVTLQNGQFKINAANKEQTIVAKDKSGNTITYSLTVSPNHNYTLQSTANPGTTTSGSATCICTVCGKNRKATLVPTNNNSVSGLKGTKTYIVGETVSIKATGYNSSLTSPKAGMTRCLPTTWSLNKEVAALKEGEFTGSKTLSASGTYTVSVNFTYQVYSGTKWIDTGFVYTYSTQISVKNKAPSYTVPERQTVEYGTQLQEIKLPNGFSWQEPGDTKLVHLGYVYAHASYKDYSTNQIVENIEIPLNVVCSNHKWIDKEYITEPTCVADGQRLQVCDICGTSRTVTEKAQGHKHETTVVAATCTEAGYTLHTCAYCEDSYKTDEKPVVAHDYEVSEHEAPCGGRAYTLQKCKLCGEEIKTEKGEVVPHTWGEKVMVMENGIHYHRYTCSTCGKIEYSEVGSEDPSIEQPTESPTEDETEEEISHIGEPEPKTDVKLVVVIGIALLLIIAALITLVCLKKSGRIGQKQ